MKIARLLLFITSFANLSLANVGVASSELVKVGEGVARWGVFKLYNAAFFTQADNNLSQALSDLTPARLELCYTRSLTVENFVDGANHALPNNLPDALQQAVNQMHAAYLPVIAGDCYQLDYQPDFGTQLILNGKSLVQIKTPNFKALYFGIWLGEQPLSKRLKANLTQRIPTE